MRANAYWGVMSAIIFMAMAISFLAAYIADGLTQVMFAACSVCFALVVILASTTRKMYLETLDKAETVRCLRLKRPGLEIREEAIQPKGKIPKG